MPKVIKIYMFLFTFIATILGLPLCKDICPTTCGSPTPQPIATAWVMLNSTSIVKGITTAVQTQLEHLSHHSNYSLYLTDPNLDRLHDPELFQVTLFKRSFLLLPQNLDRQHQINPPGNTLFSRHYLSNSASCPPCSFSIAEAFTSKPSPYDFKFKKDAYDN
jgi:hypothetical protein